MAPLNGKPLAWHVATLLEQDRYKQKIAIVRNDDDELSRIFKESHFSLGINPNSETGIASSIRVGLEIAGSAEAILIMLADMPCVTKEHLMALFDNYDPKIGVIASSLNGVSLPPAIIGAQHFPLMAHIKGDEGARSLIKGSPFIVAAQNVLQDVDDRTTLNRLNSKLAQVSDKQAGSETTVPLRKR